MSSAASVYQDLKLKFLVGYDRQHESAGRRNTVGFSIGSVAFCEARFVLTEGYGVIKKV